MIEIGCVELLGRQLTGRHYHQYVNPERSVELIASARHGITEAMLEDKPVFSRIFNEFLSFTHGAELVTYDAGHVISFLQHEISMQIGKPFQFDNDITDILRLADEKHHNQKNNLPELYSRYFIDTSQSELHGTLLESEILADLYLAITNEKSDAITSDLSIYKSGQNLSYAGTFAELDEALNGISKTALCRGVSNHEHALLPSLFRHGDIDVADVREKKMMWIFKTHAKAHFDKPPQNEVEWLTIAQHHGLPTRLLDWSFSPLIACYFAVQSLSPFDGAIYIYDVGSFKKEEEIDLANLKDIVAVLPSHSTRRVTAQSGVFTIHPTSMMNLKTDRIKKIIIRADKKKYFLEKLFKYGVHHATVFPDLDGLSRYVRYLHDYR
ncbi:FRG domain-containing protein [Cellvibrio sp. ARAG 10.3]|uniref:FRG domain-containing protein n=1 Tax=Cellvibrio sp. ARAG 10.3 TaxID=3451358 RepID=UPI003F44DA8F